jgi:hypothetical protein
MAASAYWDITVDQNVRYQAERNFFDETGAALSLTNATITAHVRKFPGGQLLLDLSDAITITDAANGEIEIDISSETLSTMTPGKYLWDMLVTYPNNNRLKVAAGTFTVIGTITV